MNILNDDPPFTASPICDYIAPFTSDVFHTRDGRQVLICTRQRPFANYPIYGLIVFEKGGQLCHWTIEGRYFVNGEDPQDIIDLPEGFFESLTPKLN